MTLIQPRAQHAFATARHAALLWTGLLLAASPVMAVDLAPLWDFQQPAVSEQRFRAALEMAVGDDALIQFKHALALREQAGNPEAVRTAHWMVAWTWRALGRREEALALQLRLEREADAAGQPDPYVFEELETLYKDQGDTARAAHYAQRRLAVSK